MLQSKFVAYERWMLHLLRSMFAAYECQLCMIVEFVVTDICCDR